MGFKYFGYFRLFFIIFGDFRLFSVISGYFQFFCRSVLGYFFLFSTVGFSVGRLFNRPTTNRYESDHKQQGPSFLTTTLAVENISQ